MPQRLKLLIVLLVALGAVTGWRLWNWHRQGGRPSGGGISSGGTSGGGGGGGENAPNILLISLDTVRPDHLGCYGYKLPTSPNLDAFARGAVRFTQARAQASWTIPSHMALFTSRLPSSDQFDGWGRSLPVEVPTLAQTLKDAGYETKGIVNNGGVQATWGFGRGYDSYEEYEPDKPEGKGGFISARALQWMEERERAPQAARKPWYLFLHYYDAHDPYDSPEPFHSQFGAADKAEADRLYRDHFRPDQPFANPEDLSRLIASYDAGIANLDHEVGKVLAHVPDNTLVIVFSDHGEAFKEHDWLWHGSTLYEEEIRCVLLMRLPPGSAPPGSAAARSAAAPGGVLAPIPGVPAQTVDAPTMLIDVAPTILSYGGISAPSSFEGMDLRPAINGAKMEDRSIYAETKSFRAGRVCKALLMPPWKLIHDVVTGQEELYRLPDEKTNLIERETKAAALLQEPMRKWVGEETFWLLSVTDPAPAPGSAPAPAPGTAPAGAAATQSQANGSGTHEFEVTLQARDGYIATVIPINLTIPERDTFKTVANGKSFEWSGRPGRRVQAAYVETLPTDAPLIANLTIDRVAHPDLVSVGPAGVHPGVLPGEFWIGPADVVKPSAVPQVSLVNADQLLSPVIERPFVPEAPGFYLRRYQRPGKARTMLPSAPMIDQRSRDQLKKLGYLE